MNIAELKKIAESSTSAVFVITTSNEDLPVAGVPSETVLKLLGDYEKMRFALEAISTPLVGMVHPVFPKCHCPRCETPETTARQCLASLEMK